jgi:DNA-binding transcriptional LysR family regulator
LKTIYFYRHHHVCLLTFGGSHDGLRLSLIYDADVLLGIKMDIKVYKTFLEVAQVKHFGRAAENLYITQAAVSARIKQLETFYGVKLFGRHRNAIQLSSAGERLVSYAQTLVRTIEQSKAELLLSNEQTTQLSIAGTPNLWDAYLQRCLSLVTNAFSGYGFNAQSLSREQICRALVDRTLDIGLSFDPLKSDELVEIHVADLELILVASSPKSQVEALKNGYVYVDWGTKFASDHALRYRHLPSPYLSTSTGRIALDFILEKGGSAYLPSSLVAPFLCSGQLFRVTQEPPWTRPVFLSYRGDSPAHVEIDKVKALLESSALTVTS